MTDTLEKLCADFIENRETVKSVYKLESSYIYPICANIFCAKGMVIQRERLEDCKRMVKDMTGVFSNFRGTIQAPVACMLASQSGAENRMERAVAYYKLLKERFFGSQYLALVAFLMADLVTEARAPEKVARGRTIYERMKQEHPLLTSSEDSVFAVLMAFSDHSDDELITDMEACYRMLKERFSNGNGVQSASHVLALTEGTPEEKTARMIALYDGIRASGGKYGKRYELSTLAALVGLDAPVETLVTEIMEMDGLLHEQRGYGGAFGLDRRARMMHAAMLVSDLYVPREQVDAAALTGTISIIAAQQAAMCAAIAGSTAAASSSSH